MARLFHYITRLDFICVETEFYYRKTVFYFITRLYSPMCFIKL